MRVTEKLIECATVDELMSSSREGQLSLDGCRSKLFHCLFDVKLNITVVHISSSPVIV